MFHLGNQLSDSFKKILRASPFETPGGVPFHPHWLLVQWGYIAAVFAALLVTVIPSAIGSPSRKIGEPAPFENPRSQACRFEVDKTKLDGASRCEINNQGPGLDWSPQTERPLPVIPLRPSNYSGGESASYLRLRPTKIVKG